MTEIRVKNTMYKLSNFYDVEEYLSNEHKNGHKFLRYEIKLFSGYFIFEECEPADVIYKLDYNEVKKDEIQNYVVHFKDFGWEYVGSKGYFALFCQENKEDAIEDDIFADNLSKAEMCKRITMTKTSLGTLGASIFCVIPTILNMFPDTVRITVLPLSFTIYIIFMIRNLIHINKLKEYIDNFSNPIELIELENKKDKSRVK